jgi:hypothetical protein
MFIFFLLFNLRYTFAKYQYIINEFTMHEIL